MGFGFQIGGGGGDFAKVVRYDARAGRIFRDDREDGVKVPVDITQTFSAVMDFEQLEVGWMRFAAGVAPDFQLVPFGSDPGARPSPDHKMGVRVMMRLAKACGGDVRELTTTAATALGGLEAVFDEYKAQVAQNRGMLPVVTLETTKPVTVKGNGQSSTNYSPVFKIGSWVKRPNDLPLKGASAPAPAPAATPPATGSTRVAPPAAQPEVETADEFG